MAPHEIQLGATGAYLHMFSVDGGYSCVARSAYSNLFPADCGYMCVLVARW